MAPTRRKLLQASALGLAGSIAGCAGATESRQETETTTDAAAETTTEADEATTRDAETLPYTVAATTHPEHGVVLTDAEGMTLYLFTQDSRGETTCYDQCAEAWPPLTVEESPTIPDGLPGEFTTVERDDGSMQVAYDGMPLYYWQGDQQPGDATGQGVNDVWFVVNPSCEGVSMGTETTTADGTTTESDDGGGGVDY